MFKIGDKIRVKVMRDFNLEKEPHLSLNKTYIIKDINIGVVSVNNNENNWRSIGINNIYKYNANKTEVDWLNAIQQNFKEGV